MENTYTLVNWGTALKVLEDRKIIGRDELNEFKMKHLHCEIAVQYMTLKERGLNYYADEILAKWYFDSIIKFLDEDTVEEIYNTCVCCKFKLEEWNTPQFILAVYTLIPNVYITAVDEFHLRLIDDNGNIIIDEFGTMRNKGVWDTNLAHCKEDVTPEMVAFAWKTLH